MKPRSIMAAVALVLLAAVACSPEPFLREGRVPVGGLAKGELLSRNWTSLPGKYRIRLTTRLEYGRYSIMVESFMELDAGGKKARIVGLDVMGMKLFDLSVREDEIVEHFMAPGVPAKIKVPSIVGTSVQRIFLRHRPGMGDRLTTGAYRYHLSRTEGRTEIQFIFGGRDEVMLEKRARGGEDDWRVRYYDHLPIGGRLLPAGIVHDDLARGYRLTLWMESGERVGG